MQLAKIALEHHLYVEGWQMQTLYQQIIAGDPNLGIEIEYNKNIAVACCVINTEENSLSVFVDEQYRHKRYGQTVIDKTLNKYHKSHHEVYGALGVDGSEKFYQN